MNHEQEYYTMNNISFSVLCKGYVNYSFPMPSLKGNTCSNFTHAMETLGDAFMEAQYLEA